MDEHLISGDEVKESETPAAALDQQWNYLGKVPG